MNQEIVEYKPHEAAIADIQRFKGLVVDVSTPNGLADGKAAQRQVASVRIALDKSRKKLKEDVLERGRQIDGQAKLLFLRVAEIEEPINAQIEAYTKRVEREREEKVRIERERLEAEARAAKEAEDAKLAAERAEIQRQKDELARQQREAAAKIEADARAARLKIKEEERAARLARDEADRKARQAREAEEARIAAERAKIESERRAVEDAQRKAREAEEHAAAQARAKNEAALSEIQGIQQQAVIAELGRAGVRRGGTLECALETLRETKAWPVTEEHFGALFGSAKAAKAKAISDIKAIIRAIETRIAEDQQRRNKAEVDNGFDVLTTFHARFGEHAQFKDIAATIGDWLAKNYLKEAA